MYWFLVFACLLLYWFTPPRILSSNFYAVINIYEIQSVLELFVVCFILRILGTSTPKKLWFYFQRNSSCIPHGRYMWPFFGDMADVCATYTKRCSVSVQTYQRPFIQWVRQRAYLKHTASVSQKYIRYISRRYSICICGVYASCIPRYNRRISIFYVYVC